MEPRTVGENRQNTMRHHAQFVRGRVTYCNCFRGMRLGDRIKWPGERKGVKKYHRWAETFKYGRVR